MGVVIYHVELGAFAPYFLYVRKMVHSVLDSDVQICPLCPSLGGPPEHTQETVVGLHVVAGGDCFWIVLMNAPQKDMEHVIKL